ncbi:MAG TPA: YbhB/YbcL family Raf kinase inhibitor-like protein [Saprospiraceae bacterium]|nr:YbhB/YbcL family Raf kinase inhibitor-like protein [Saprospiraceae bacterium]
MGILIFLILNIIKLNVLEVSSPAFDSYGFIPDRYTCNGKNVNPSLFVQNIPSNTKSLAVILTDPNSTDNAVDHWSCWNIKPSDIIVENTKPGIEGRNSIGLNAYEGPCPPSGTHHYIFKVYALDKMLDLKPGAEKKEVLKAMEKHILALGELIGKYQNDN